MKRSMEAGGMALPPWRTEDVLMRSYLHVACASAAPQSPVLPHPRPPPSGPSGAPKDVRRLLLRHWCLQQDSPLFVRRRRDDLPSSLASLSCSDGFGGEYTPECRRPSFRPPALRKPRRDSPHVGSSGASLSTPPFHSPLLAPHPPGFTPPGSATHGPDTGLSSPLRFPSELLALVDSVPGGPGLAAFSVRDVSDSDQFSFDKDFTYADDEDFTVGASALSSQLRAGAGAAPESHSVSSSLNACVFLPTYPPLAMFSGMA